VLRLFTDTVGAWYARHHHRPSSQGSALAQGGLGASAQAACDGLFGDAGFE